MRTRKSKVEQWSDQHRSDAVSLIARNFRAFQVRIKKDFMIQQVYYWLWTLHTGDDYEPTPDCVDWYYARTLPRYFRICTERLRQLYNADIRQRIKHNSPCEEMKLRIECMLDFSLYADHLRRALIPTEEEPVAVAKIRERVTVVPVAFP